MNVALANLYGPAYDQDKVFDPYSCNIGENLLVPGIVLREKYNELNDSFHTFDMYSIDDIDVAIYQDIKSSHSVRLFETPKDVISYFLRRCWKYDYFSKSIDKTFYKILIMQEPPTVCPTSYKEKYHKYFDKILTWDDNLVDNTKYYKFFYPQPLPNKTYCIEFDNKRLLTIMCSNKHSNHPDELYSEREKAIRYFDRNCDDFDIFGYGWEKYHSFKGSVNSKLDTISKYKFSICYENIKSTQGYITEKIFDCFFAGCVPIYWGADNITDYIPQAAFIDRRDFNTYDDLFSFISSISEENYNEYISSAKDYLNSKKFYEQFSVDAYCNNIITLTKSLLQGS